MPDILSSSKHDEQLGVEALEPGTTMGSSLNLIGA